MRNYNKLNFEEKLVLIIIPIINGIALSSTGFFKESQGGVEGSFNPGDIRAVLVLFFLIYFFIFRRVRNVIATLINTLGVIILLSCLYSVDFVYSFPIAIKFFIWSSFFALGFYYMDTMWKFLIYCKVYIISYFGVFISLWIANILEIGLGIYSSGLRAGAAGVSVVLQLTHLFFFVPFFLRINKNVFFNVLAKLLLIISFIYISVSSKRGALLGLIIGFILYLVYTPNRKVLLKIVPFVLISMVVISLLFSDIINEIYLERSTRFELQYEENLEKEGRYFEIIYTTEYVLKDVKSFFIGYGFFSETAISSKFVGYARQNHIDYFSILYGTGFIGLIFYIFTYIYAFKVFNKYRKINNSYVSNELFAIVVGSFSCLSILAISSTITQIDHRAFIYFFYGGILRIMTDEKKIFPNNFQIESS